MRKGRYLDAERRARVLVQEMERLHGAESMPTAEALDQLTQAMQSAGHSGAADARAVAERAVRIKEELVGRSAPEYAASLHDLGALHMNNGDYSRARPLLEEALHIRERTLGGSHPLVARSLEYLANVEFQLGRHGAADTLLQRAASIERAALPENDPDRVRAASMLAGVRYDQGDYATPAVLWHEVLDARLRILGPDHPFVAETLHNLGALAAATGDYSEGLRYLGEALTIRRRVNPRQPFVASTLIAIAQTRVRMGDVRRGLARFQEALRVQEDPANRSRSDVAWTLFQIGDAWIQLREYGRAKPFLTRAKEIQERELGPTHPDLAWTLNALALVAQHEERQADAESLFVRSLRITESAFGTSHPRFTDVEGQFAAFLASRGDTVRAFDLAGRAARAGVDHLRVTAGGLSERQALAYQAAGSKPLDLVLAMAASGEAGRAAPAWDALIRSRAVVFDEIAARHGAARLGLQDSSIAGLRRNIDTASQRLANLLVRGTADEPARYRALVERAREDVEDAERTLASRSRRFKSGMSRQDVGWNEVSNALPERWGLVSFALHGIGAGRAYVALVGRRGRAPLALSIGPASEIDPLVQRFASAVGRGDRTARGTLDRGAEASCRAAGGALRRRIWDPLRESVRGLDGLFVVPDGSLWLVNLAALPSGRDHYLVEDGPLIQYLSAERDLVRPPHREEGRGLLALGGAGFDARGESASPDPAPPPRAVGSERRSLTRPRGPQPDCDEFRHARFAPLPEAAREVEEIAAAWGNASEARVLTGSRASESALKALAPGHRVLHLATHGFFLDASRCAAERSRARGIGAVGGFPVGTPAPAPRESPLLVSGLALAGANLRLQARPDEDDGVLMAQEVVSMDLSATEWVVLSACDTGLGKVQAGEGVLGLRRAFEEAGAGAVIMSLWEVEDRSTRDWMRSLYESRFRLRRSTPEAVRDADLSVLRDRRVQGLGTHPFYWAGFVATGDWK